MSENSDGDCLGEPQLDYDAWRERLQKACGRYNPEGIEPDAFTGWIRPFEVCGFKGLEAGCNAGRIERDSRDVRLDYAQREERDAALLVEVGRADATRRGSS